MHFLTVKKSIILLSLSLSDEFVNKRFLEVRNLLSRANIQAKDVCLYSAFCTFSTYRKIKSSLTEI